MTKKIKMDDYIDMLSTPDETADGKETIQSLKEKINKDSIKKPELPKSDPEQLKKNRGLMDDYFQAGFGTKVKNIKEEHLDEGWQSNIASSYPNKMKIYGSQGKKLDRLFDKHEELLDMVNSQIIDWTIQKSDELAAKYNEGGNPMKPTYKTVELYFKFFKEFLRRKAKKEFELELLIVVTKINKIIN